MTAKDLRDRLAVMPDDALIVIELQEGRGVEPMGEVYEVRVAPFENRCHMDGDYQMLQKSGQPAVLLRPTGYGEPDTYAFADYEDE